MKTPIKWIAAVWLLGMVVPQVSFGQLPNGGWNGNSNIYNSKPVISPYLNLNLNTGLGTGVDYQNFVRPLIEQQQFQQQAGDELARLNRQVGGIQNRIQRSTSYGGRMTGHPTRFMNYSHYYQVRTR